MTTYFWDSSALVKRYTTEKGSQIVSFLYESSGIRQITCPIIYAETFAVLLRKRNRQEIRPLTFRNTVAFLQNELLSGKFLMLEVDNAAFYDAVPLIEVHNINTSDATFLGLCIRYRASFPDGDFVVIASDTRLLRASMDEGFQALNPERQTSADFTQDSSLPYPGSN